MATPSISLLAIIGIFTVTLNGCASARIVKVRPGKGGEIALLGSRQEAMQKAIAIMQSNCPRGYEIVEEGEHVVGQVESSRGNISDSSLRRGSIQTSNTTVVRNQTEWRISYKCSEAK